MWQNPPGYGYQTCPTCGRCPTCGNYRQQQLQPYWQIGGLQGGQWTCIGSAGQLGSQGQAGSQGQNITSDDS